MELLSGEVLGFDVSWTGPSRLSRSRSDASATSVHATAPASAAARSSVGAEVGGHDVVYAAAMSTRVEVPNGPRQWDRDAPSQRWCPGREACVGGARILVNRTWTRPGHPRRQETRRQRVSVSPETVQETECLRVSC
eukprot:5389107-Prymnesium_polylepis.2